ncbi:hypothetical protein [Fibrobacter sp. UWB5]|uniref:hypothetical protein n=1 Tax=Fibrobacter sp. UWB5 TaxID=1964360 RepID=UPI000B5241DF|nr:hypothetical protein [Fibrobacter sp. UWB5]OWV13944.1 hypothetical protein B7989_00260 [Fibrobacter sp. UWB5]
MIEIIAKTIGTQVGTTIANEVAKHSDEILYETLELAGDAVEFAGECVCDILNGIGNLFDP